jgi:hypothetical protein
MVAGDVNRHARTQRHRALHHLGVGLLRLFKRLSWRIKGNGQRLRVVINML